VNYSGAGKEFLLRDPDGHVLAIADRNGAMAMTTH
jgi:hypothetical protein